MENSTASGAGSGGMGDDGMRMMSPPPSGSMSHGGGMMMMMHMTFFWGSRVQILFSGWPGDRGIGHYILALLLVLVASVLVEALSSLSRRIGRGRMGLLLTMLHAVRMGLAYMVMLAVMSFNVGVLIAAIAGHGLGFLVSGRGKSTSPDGEDSLHSAVRKN